jgi:hypothetical protein
MVAICSDPRDAELLALRINDEPVVFRVVGVIHAPVMSLINPEDKVIVPAVTVVIERAAANFQPTL